MSTPEDETQDARAADVAPPVTREQYLAWRSPRLGASNPQRLDNPVWEWLVRSGMSAYQANQVMDGPPSQAAGPGWCFERFGRSTTALPDGRLVHIAGEHEDHYDPDFFIYNDVVVQHPDGSIEIYGYPREAFPPTDFHSATLVGDRIVLVGNLGYPRERRGSTQVLVLDLATFAVVAAATVGTSPGWIHEHTAVLADDGRSIVVTGGQLDRGDAPRVENIDDWRLHLADWRWERLTERRWPRRAVRRADGRRNHLWELEQAAWFRSVGWEAQLQEELERLLEETGRAPDLELAARLYRPALAHTACADGDSHDTVRITVDGVVVRYVRTMGEVQMTVEGELPAALVDALAEDLRDKLSAIENAPCEVWTL